MMSILRISLVLVMTSTLAAGCLGGRHAQRQALAQKRTFVPLAGVAKPLALAPRAAAVKVRAFRALPPFDARAFIVRRPGGEFAADYYNGWLAAPHELIRVQATRYLEASGLFAAVYDSASGTVAPLGLEGLVTELYLDHSGAAPAGAGRTHAVVHGAGDARGAGARRLYARRSGCRLRGVRPGVDPDS